MWKAFYMKNQEFLFDIPKHALPETSSDSYGKVRLQYANRVQVEMKMSCLDDLLIIDHPVRRIWEYLEGIDLSQKLKNIKSVEGNAGRPAIDPRILVALWLYATVQGIGSAYVIAQYTKEHLAFQWICGGVPVERRTISQFRIDNGELFENLLAQGIVILIKAGAVTLEEVAQDGLRVRASTGSGSFRRESTIEELYTAAKQRIQELKNESKEDINSCRTRQETDKKRGIQDRLDRLNRAKEEFEKYTENANEMRKRHKKKVINEEEKQEIRISTTDPEARKMKMADGGFRPAYNFQVAVDTAKNLIIGTDVVNAGTDGGQMLQMYDAIKAKLGKSPKNYLVDGGFKSKSDVEHMTRDGCTIFMPVQEHSKKGKIENPYEPKPNETEAMDHLRIRMGQESAKKAYKRRAATVELVNANLRKMNLYQITVRGLKKAKTIANMFAVTYNMLRTISLGLV
jgi:transposase